MKYLNVPFVALALALARMSWKAGGYQIFVFICRSK